MEPKAPTEILRRWLLALGCFAFLIFFFSPTWGAFRLWSQVPGMGGMIEVRRGEAVLQQIAHPGAEIADKLHAAIQWRLLFPAIAHVLHLSPAVFFALPGVGCVLVLAFAIAVLRRRGAGFGFAACAALVLGAGSWYFTSVCWLGYFDSWVVLALLFVAFAETSWPVWLACMWAPWVDERFVLALPLALMCRWLQCATRGKPLNLKQEVIAPAILAVAFVGVRLGLLESKTASGATVGGYLNGLENGGAASRIGFGIWAGLRLGWLPVVAALCWLSRERAILLGVAIVLLVATGIATAQDFSRAMMFVMPAALLGAVLAVGRLAKIPRWLPVAAAALALVVPAHHVMSNWVNPVRTLPTELALLKTPPPAMRAQQLEFEAREAMQKRDFGRAMEKLNEAIPLAAHPAGLLRSRGMLLASAGRWADAKRDISAALEQEPGDAETWFLRAQIELASGELAAARNDVAEAKSRAPADWTSRPDVARVLQLLR